MASAFTLSPVGPINTVPLFPKLSAELQSALHALSADDWNLPTACAGWTVKDVAAHLLDTELRRLSSHRDGWHAPGPNRQFDSFQSLVNYLNELNEQWVEAHRRVSPAWLMSMLAQADQQLNAYLETLDLNAPARVAVGWAGETQSTNWFDIAREYTERWLHQQHIREAASQPLLLTQPFFPSLLDTFIRALPYTLRNTSADEGAVVSVIINEDVSTAWSARREGDAWRLYTGADSNAAASLYIPANIAWRLFSKGLTADQARPQTRIRGNVALVEAVLHMVSLMA